MADNDAPGAWPIWTPGSRLAGIIKGHTNHCFTQNIKALGLMVSEKNIFYVFSYYKSMEANDPRGVANLDPRCMICRIYKGYHKTLLHTKYIGFRPCGLRDEIFSYFPIKSLC